MKIPSFSNRPLLEFNNLPNCFGVNIKLALLTISLAVKSKSSLPTTYFINKIRLEFISSS